MDFLEYIADDPGPIIALVAIVGGLTVAMTSIISSAIVAAARNASRERSRREIAAYVAEGSMTPEEGERLMLAGKSAKRSGCSWGD